jgi:chromosome segregation ATPase
MGQQPTQHGNNNQRVTNAELRKDIQHLSERVEEWRKEDREEQEKINQRLRVVERHTTSCSTRWDEHRKTHGRINADIETVESDVKKWSSFGGAAGAVVSFIASMFVQK